MKTRNECCRWNHLCRRCLEGIALTLGLLLWNGCAPSGAEKPMPSHQEGAGHHEHVAPHGGTLIELGEHQYQLEWVSDSGVGRLTLYVLDAHAENYVRIAMPSIVVLLKTPQGNAEVRLQAVGNSKTGETVGDTSQFEILDGAWKGVRSFEGVFQEVLIRGTRFHDVPFKAASANLSG